MRIFSAIMVLLFYQSMCDANIWLKKRTTHKCKSLKSDGMKRLAATYDENKFFNNLLSGILKIRVPGTPAHAEVQRHIHSTLEALPGWVLEDDKFEMNTIIGDKNFTNIIARYNPGAERFLTLACHYDSKLLPNFLGATDSAVPCAILLDVAIALTPKLQEKSSSVYPEEEVEGDEICYCQCGVLDLFNGMGEVGLQLIFFDGEEAFRSWTKTDSIYGARHLAAKMEGTVNQVTREVYVNQLEQMDLMILLDLIGAGGSNFYNWFPDKSGPAFERMSKIEKKLLRERDEYNRPLISRSYFVTGLRSGAGIEDDHIPFKDRDVPVLHMIAYPFPNVWHTTSDNLAALDKSEIKDMCLIMKVFVCEYLRLAC